MPLSVITTDIDSVDKLYGVNFTGNLVPPEWCHRIVGSNGKPNMNAIMILAEIVYWYRPKVEQVGEDDVKLSKKFKADLLQLSYGKIEEKFNLSRDQVKRALDLLESLGLIQRELRTIKLEDKRRLNNVMYIRLLTDNVLKLTADQKYDPGGIKPQRSCDKTGEVCGKTLIDDQTEPITNTKNTTEITTKDYDSIYQAETERVREQVDYEVLARDMVSDRGMIDEIVAIIAENNLYGMEPQLINGERIPASIIRKRFRKINSYVVKEVIDSLRSAPRNIVNTRGYIMTALYNASSTYELGLDMEVTRDMFRREASTWEA